MNSIKFNTESSDGLELMGKCTIANTSENIWWKAIISVAYGSGLRRGEILNLTWADTDFENQQVYIAAKSLTENIFECSETCRA